MHCIGRPDFSGLEWRKGWVVDRIYRLVCCILLDIVIVDVVFVR
jgi:hypothetical protein